MRHSEKVRFRVRYRPKALEDVQGFLTVYRDCATWQQLHESVIGISMMAEPRSDGTQMEVSTTYRKFTRPLFVVKEIYSCEQVGELIRDGFKEARAWLDGILTGN